MLVGLDVVDKVGAPDGAPLELLVRHPDARVQDVDGDAPPRARVKRVRPRRQDGVGQDPVAQAGQPARRVHLGHGAGCCRGSPAPRWHGRRGQVGRHGQVHVVLGAVEDGGVLDGVVLDVADLGTLEDGVHGAVVGLQGQAAPGAQRGRVDERGQRTARLRAAAAQVAAGHGGHDAGLVGVDGGGADVGAIHDDVPVWHHVRRRRVHDGHAEVEVVLATDQVEAGKGGDGGEEEGGKGEETVSHGLPAGKSVRARK